jgi:hypothetical protein
MTKYLPLIASVFLLFSCGKEKKEDSTAKLTFTTESYKKKTSLPCTEPCANVSITVPVVQNVSIAADSINQKTFDTVRQIIFFGEKPYTAKNYEELMDSFIKSYEDLKKDFPEDVIGWEGKIKGSVDYSTDNVLNLKINHYTYTGGAHGYEGNRSLLFDPKTGKALTYKDIFKDENAFKQFAETKFREKFKIPASKNINSTGLMFEKEKFTLPQNIFFKENGLLLFYNSYEIAAYAEGQKELLLPYSEVDQYIKIK